jgi:poly(hydroxyalkanoate) granule-associated protein
VLTHRVNMREQAVHVGPVPASLIVQSHVRRWTMAEEEVKAQEDVAEVAGPEKTEEAAGAAPKSPVDRMKKTVSDTAEQVQQSPFVGMAHKMALAGIGAGALTKEEAEKLLKKLIDRGQIAEAESRKAMKESMERRRKHARRAMRGAKKAEAEMDKHIEDVLSRMNIPTKAEIEALSAKITTLTRKVDELKKSSQS